MSTSKMENDVAKIGLYTHTPAHDIYYRQMKCTYYFGKSAND